MEVLLPAVLLSHVVVGSLFKIVSHKRAAKKLKPRSNLNFPDRILKVRSREREGRMRSSQEKSVKSREREKERERERESETARKIESLFPKVTPGNFSFRISNCVAVGPSRSQVAPCASGMPFPSLKWAKYKLGKRRSDRVGSRCKLESTA